MVKMDVTIAPQANMEITLVIQLSINALLVPSVHLARALVLPVLPSAPPAVQALSIPIPAPMHLLRASCAPQVNMLPLVDLPRAPTVSLVLMRKTQVLVHAILANLDLKCLMLAKTIVTIAVPDMYPELKRLLLVIVALRVKNQMLLKVIVLIVKEASFLLVHRLLVLLALWDISMHPLLLPQPLAMRVL